MRPLCAHQCQTFRSSAGAAPALRLAHHTLQPHPCARPCNCGRGKNIVLNSHARPSTPPLADQKPLNTSCQAHLTSARVMCGFVGDKWNTPTDALSRSPEARAATASCRCGRVVHVVTPHKGLAARQRSEAMGRKWRAMRLKKLGQSGSLHTLVPGKLHLTECADFHSAGAWARTLGFPRQLEPEAGSCCRQRALSVLAGLR
jgi:hypothetical protein